MKPAIALVLLMGLVATAFLGATPGAEAQAGVRDPNLQVTVVDPGQDLVATRPNALLVEVEYRYPPGSFTTEDVEVHLEVTLHPEWATPEMNESVVTLTLDPETFGAGGRVRGSTIVNLTLDPMAPAGEREGFVVRGVAQPTGNLNGAERASPEIGLRPAFVPVLNVTAAESVRLTGGKPHEIPFTVTNEGNGETTVEFTTLVTPRNAQVEIPESITLQQGESATVRVKITTPWTAPERGILTLGAQPVMDAAAAGPSGPKTFEGTTRVDGASVVPGAPVLAVLAALGVACVASRRPR